MQLREFIQIYTANIRFAFCCRGVTSDWHTIDRTSHVIHKQIRDYFIIIRNSRYWVLAANIPMYICIANSTVYRVQCTVYLCRSLLSFLFVWKVVIFTVIKFNFRSSNLKILRNGNLWIYYVCQEWLWVRYLWTNQYLWCDQSK